MVTWLPIGDVDFDDPCRNQLLAALPPVERVRLMEPMQRRLVTPGEVLYEPGRRCDHVFFPETAVISLLTVLEDGSGIETATIGCEGMAGIYVFLGDDRSRNGRAVAQMGGSVLRLHVDSFRAQLGEGGKLGQLLPVYTRALLVHVSQSVACSAVHPVRARLARWLLQTSDRTSSDDVPLTQQFLADILGVRRASVTEAVAELHSRGELAPRRGGMLILDRAGLTRSACECYEVVRREYARLVPGS
jgi:CRP-like cAMP-binding protein